ncbi:hypothetical protein Tco_0052254 [Tanacetum coccineum]|uniref:Uncharacterized protein n=1 Tax=Tanacetum coccineum TaxID=301880 RepID=A0ABQ5ETJ1_9ASTR
MWYPITNVSKNCTNVRDRMVSGRIDKVGKNVRWLAPISQAWHYRSDYPKLKNGNQARGTKTRRRVLALVGGETNQDLDDKEDNTNA